MSGALRIVKVGGSLFSLPDLPQRLRRWFSSQPPATNVLLAGGGPLADAVRQWDARFGLGQERSHWLCVDLLDSTARLLHHLLPEARLCCDLRELPGAGDLTLVFAPSRFLRKDEPTLSGSKLPRSWDVTSDSIAARLAEVTGAQELVLLKSSLPQPFRSLQELSRDYVDQHFAQAVRALPAVRFVSLRDEGFPQIRVSATE
jgi:aspartokinase-like uncharacterized kinase